MQLVSATAPCRGAYLPQHRLGAARDSGRHPVACCSAAPRPRAAAVGRRQALAAAPSLALLLSPREARAAQGAGDWSSPGLNQEPEISAPFIKTASGAQYQDIFAGTSEGEGAKMGDLVEINYVLRRSNGYFVYGTVEGVGFQPKDVPVGPVYYTLGKTRIIQGLEEVLVGMKPGAKRRAYIPPRLGYLEDESLEPQPPGYGPKRQIAQHKNEPLLFEVQMVKVVAGGK